MNINEKVKEMSSISELKEIAKYISKEEFLKKVINHNNACPKIINLEDCGDHGICSTTPCYSRWENAIKDIKFKGENDMEFDWEGFKNNDFAVLCDTEEKAKDFLKECYKRGLSWSDGKSAENYIYYKGYDTCYTYNFNNWEHLQYSSKSFYLDNGYKVIEWETENKIDYDREYNIMEIMEFPENTNFVRVSDDLLLKIGCSNNGECKILINICANIECKLSDIWTKSKFKIVKKDKKVSFKEAIQAYGKEIYCILDDGETKVNYYIESKNSPLLDKNNIIGITPEEILNGEWYIKED